MTTQRVRERKCSVCSIYHRRDQFRQFLLIDLSIVGDIVPDREKEMNE